jgi:beta-ribofuranosylaminobenzene 5'-phosphate synthase
MSNTVTIKVPARLHLGFLDPGGDGGRQFGSIGLPLSDPQTVVTLSRSRETSVEGEDSGRAAAHLETVCRRVGLSGHHRLVVEEAIPRHAGLGSGTQIALAVALALRALHDLPPDPRSDATLLSRGARSGIGIASVADGGVIVDAGRTRRGGPPPVVARLPFPNEWRVILILDRAGEGLHGAAEIEAFGSLLPFPASGVGKICRHVLMELLPALADRDLDLFGAAVSAIQEMVGAHFAPAQGGLFTSQRVEEVARRLEALGAVGIGQSSWGPTGFAFAGSEADASGMIAAVQGSAGKDIEVRAVRGRNFGAKVFPAPLDMAES